MSKRPRDARAADRWALIVATIAQTVAAVANLIRSLRGS